jgi:hypothetical protein
LLEAELDRRVVVRIRVLADVDELEPGAGRTDDDVEH